MFITWVFPTTHLIRNNGIHVSHMFLMKLNLEECGLLMRRFNDLWGEFCGKTTGNGNLWGDFSLSATVMIPTCLPTTRPISLFSTVLHPHLYNHVFNLESTSLSRLCTSMCVRRISSWQLEIYMAKSLHVSQAFRPSLVPTVRPLTHGLQPILSSYRMRQCRTWGGQDLADTSLSKDSL